MSVANRKPASVKNTTGCAMRTLTAGRMAHPANLE